MKREPPDEWFFLSKEILLNVQSVWEVLFICDQTNLTSQFHVFNLRWLLLEGLAASNPSPPRAVLHGLQCHQGRRQTGWCPEAQKDKDSEKTHLQKTRTRRRHFLLRENRNWFDRRRGLDDTRYSNLSHSGSCTEETLAVAFNTRTTELRPTMKSCNGKQIAKQTETAMGRHRL